MEKHKDTMPRESKEVWFMIIRHPSLWRVMSRRLLSSVFSHGSLEIHLCSSLCGPEIRALGPLQAGAEQLPTVAHSGKQKHFKTGTSMQKVMTYIIYRALYHVFFSLEGLPRAHIMIQEGTFKHAGTRGSISVFHFRLGVSKTWDAPQVLKLLETFFLML